VAQIWGNKPQHFLESARLLQEMGFDGIDINMGCPVPKIVKNGSCAALIENPSLAREIYLATCEGAPNLPISIKTRIGFRTRRTEEWCGFLLKLHPAALTVHARTAKEMSDVPADWNEIAKVCSLRDELGFATIIIGNGDVTSMAEVRHRVESTGVDGVMIGRGIFQNLFVFNGDESTPLRERSVKEKLDLLMRHAKSFTQEWAHNKDFALIKRFIKIYASNFPGASELRVQLMENGSSAEDLEKVIDMWLANHTRYLLF
jgi:tRNA-dihydrouridine synthase